MIDFIKRNMPVLLIGLVTLAVFVGLIIMAQKNPPNEPKLIQIDESKLITDHTFFQGPDNALLTIVEFSNYNCPYCAQAHPYVQSLLDTYPGLMRWGFRHLPFASDPTSLKAAVAAQAAGRQDKFWEYNEVLFANQGTFTEDNLKKYAEELGLDMEKFVKDFEDSSTEGEVVTDRDYALVSGVSGTPTFFLNGKHVELNDIVREISKYIEVDPTQVQGEEVIPDETSPVE